MALYYYVVVGFLAHVKRQRTSSSYSTLRKEPKLASIARDHQPTGVWSKRVEFDEVDREGPKEGECLLAKRGHEGAGVDLG